MNEKIARSNFRYCTEAIDLKKELEVRYLDFAEHLYRISTERMFDPNYESFEEFLEDVKTSPATASKLINIWQRFVLDFKISNEILSSVGWSKAAEVLPFAKNRTQAVAWLTKAQTMSKKHLREEIQEAKTGIPIDECLHGKLIIFSKCLDCGEIKRVYDN